MQFRAFSVIALLAFLAFPAGRTDAQRQPFMLPQRPERPHYVEGEVLLKFKKDAAPSRTLYRKNDVVGVATLLPQNIVVLKSGTKTTDELLRGVRSDPAVEYAEPNFLRYLDAVPNDVNYGELWGLNNTGQTMNGTVGTPDADIDAPEAWDVATGSSTVTVAVIDSGIGLGHPDLAGNLVAGYDFVDNDSVPEDKNDHGTHVAGVISAIGNNAAGVTGVNWTVKIMPLRVADISGSISGANFILALNYAVAQGVKIINYSAGGTTFSQAEYDALASAKSSGVLFITAAGNDGTNNDGGTHHYPSDYDLDNIISVAASDQNDALANFSNYGTTSVDVAAPGVNIYSTVPYRMFSENFDGATTPGFIGTQFTSSGSNNYWMTAGTTDKAAYGDTYYSPYQNNSNGILTSSVVDTSTQDSLVLQYDYIVESETTPSCTNDYFSAEVFTGSVWTEVKRRCGTGTTGADKIDISGYKNAALQTRFQWISNATDSNYVGAAVNNVALVSPQSANGSYAFMQGTSMATPYVAGLAALLKSAKPGFTYLGIRNTILNNIDHPAALSGATVTSGRINAASSVANIDGVAPTATVGYSNTNPTRDAVVATLTANEPIIVTNNSAATTYTFLSNGGMTFEFIDLAGNSGSAVATVNNIDTTAPIITITPYSTALTNKDITVTATTNEGTLNASSYTFAANGTFDFIATDAAGNVTTTTVTITNIDKTAHPTGKTLKMSNGSYVVTTGSKKVTIRPFGKTYKGELWGRKIDFRPLEGVVYLFANRESYSKGGIRAYDAAGKFIKWYKPFSSYAKVGLVLDAAANADDTVFLAVAERDNGTSVKIFTVTKTGLTVVNSVKGVKVRGDIVVKFSKIYGSDYGLLTYHKGKKSTLKIWKYSTSSRKFVEDKNYKKSKIKL
ncbi:MAG: S8 family serine peptidase [Candidatus Kerfeldbacteria bacterium]|nr:S8 family serine peptidase [Candidatus Kerfeldbacteria bacterium]